MSDPRERYDHNANNVTGTPVDEESDLVPIQLWREEEAEIERLRANLAEAKYLHENQMENAWHERQERDEARKVARHLYSLWPSEYFATLAGIIDDYPWLEQEND